MACRRVRPIEPAAIDEARFLRRAALFGLPVHIEFRLEEEYSVIADEFVRYRVMTGRGGMSGRKPTFLLLQILISTMALHLDQIRATAERVAASHGLDVVDIEYQGGSKHRILRIFIEKNAEQRAKLAQDGAEGGLSSTQGDRLAGITHDDCQVFSQDFGTVLDVEELVPGAEYTLEVSSPGLDRKLHGEADYRRFSGSLVKLQTFEPIAGNRHWQGRLTEVKDRAIVLDLSAVRQKGKGKKNPASEAVEIEFANIEKANLVPEI